MNSSKLIRKKSKFWINLLNANAENLNDNERAASTWENKSGIKVLNLVQAAIFLQMNPEVVRRMTKAGTLPGAKPAKEWRFIDEDLVNWIRGGYKCSINEKPSKDISGIQTFRSTDSEYTDLLGLAKKARHKNLKKN